MRIVHINDYWQASGRGPRRFIVVESDTFGGALSAWIETFMDQKESDSECH